MFCVRIIRGQQRQTIISSPLSELFPSLNCYIYNQETTSCGALQIPPPLKCSIWNFFKRSLSAPSFCFSRFLLPASLCYFLKRTDQFMNTLKITQHNLSSSTYM